MGCHSQPDDRFPRARAAEGRWGGASDRGDGDHRVRSRRGRQRITRKATYTKQTPQASGWWHGRLQS